MIEFTKAFKTSDGETHGTLEAAQRHELELLFKSPGGNTDHPTTQQMVEDILANSDRIVDILTTTASSKPKARKINGGKKTRAPKPAADTP